MYVNVSKPYQDGKIFKVSIQHIDEKKMYAYISISPNYPLNAPRVSVFTEDNKNAANDVQLQYIEEHVRPHKKSPVLTYLSAICACQ